MPSSRGSSQPRNQTGSPALQADSLAAELPGKPRYPFTQIQPIEDRGVNKHVNLFFFFFFLHYVFLDFGQ